MEHAQRQRRRCKAWESSCCEAQADPAAAISRCMQKLATPRARQNNCKPRTEVQRKDEVGIWLGARQAHAPWCSAKARDGAPCLLLACLAKRKTPAAHINPPGCSEKARMGLPSSCSRRASSFANRMLACKWSTAIPRNGTGCWIGGAHGNQGSEGETQMCLVAACYFALDGGAQQQGGRAQDIGLREYTSAHISRLSSISWLVGSCSCAVQLRN